MIKRFRKKTRIRKSGYLLINVHKILAKTSLNWEVELSTELPSCTFYIKHPNIWRRVIFWLPSFAFYLNNS